MVVWGSAVKTLYMRDATVIRAITRKKEDASDGR
jgi:hypothetical protein